MAFWTDATLQDPKRAYRFLVTLGNMTNGAQWYAKSATKPSFTVGETEHKFLNHTFYYPTGTTWDPVTVTLVDPLQPDAANQVLAILVASGYDPSKLSQGEYGTTTSKDAATDALGVCIIKQIDHLGDAVETWTLWNAFITAAKFSELSYDSDDMSTIELTFRYDWAELWTSTVPELEGGVASSQNLLKVGT
jgi:hypothetical protein